MCQAATVGGLMLYAGNGWFQKVILLRKISILRTLAPLSTHGISHQVMGKLHQNSSWRLIQWFLSFKLGFLLSICSLSSSLLIASPLLLLPFWPWILVFTCFWVTRVCFYLSSMLGFPVCFCFALMLWIRNWFLLSSSIACQFPHSETMAVKLSSHLSVGKLGWAVLLFSLL